MGWVARCQRLPEPSDSELREQHGRRLQYHLDLGEALPLSHDGLLSRERQGSRRGDRRTSPAGTAEPFRVAPPEAAAYECESFNWVDDFEDPPMRKVVFSLVTGITNGTEGSLGQDGAGVERPNANPCP